MLKIVHVAYLRGALSPIISSGDEGKVSLRARRTDYCTDDNCDSWGELGGGTRPGGVAPGCRVRYPSDRRSSREIARAAPRRGQAPAPRPHPERRVEGDSAGRDGRHARSREYPVLTLSTSLKEALGDGRAFIPWPCRLEDLTKRIEAALLPARSWKSLRCRLAPKQSFRSLQASDSLGK